MNPNLRDSYYESTPLVHAAESESAGADLLELLISAGANVNAYVCGSPLLFEATEKKDLEAVRLLVERGADLYIRDAYGFSVLESSEGSSPEILAYLRSVLAAGN